MFVASKLWNEFHKPEDVEPALRQSLANLGLEYLDLFLMHWPFAFERQHQKTNIIHPVDFSKKVTPQPTEVGQYKNNSCTLKPKTEFSFN